MNDSPDPFEELPVCPNCGSTNVDRTPALRSDYRCLNCGTEFDEGGRGVIVE
jgi:ribosomal protein L37AE/L43A